MAGAIHLILNGVFSMCGHNEFFKLAAIPRNWLDAHFLSNRTTYS
jgi:hypothetical protein